MSDLLTKPSRDFYERAKYKFALSVIFAVGGLILLAFCSAAGGLSASNNADSQVKNVNDDHEILRYKALAGGYGFAAFCYILGFLMMLSAAVWISPAFCGSPNERKTIGTPTEVEAFKQNV